MIFTQATDDTLDYAKLDRMLDKVKSAVFIGNQSAFFAPLMGALNFVWSTDVDTAGTDGVTLWWNPHFFLEAPIKYGSTTFNEFVLRHELWHVACLHSLRRDTRCPDIWNVACDFRINSNLRGQGADWGTFPAYYDSAYDTPKHLAEEQIYDLLDKNGGGGFKGKPNPWGNGDLQADGDPHQIVRAVVRSMTNARMENKAGDIPGNIIEHVEKFLKPVVPWEKHLRQWFTDLSEDDHTWRRPNRRHSTIYLPTRVKDEGKLKHLVYFQDVSGSINQKQIIRVNSELKYVWDYFRPERMTVIQFDKRITKIDEYKTGEEFTKIKIVGRGGTSLVPVRQAIIDMKPTAAIIFSDLAVAPMRPLPINIPVLWIALDSPNARVPFGKLIHIKV